MFELTFKTKREAKEYLAESGYTYERKTTNFGRASDTKGEVYGAGPMTAILRPVPFRGYHLWIAA